MSSPQPPGYPQDPSVPPPSGAPFAAPSGAPLRRRSKVAGPIVLVLTLLVLVGIGVMAWREGKTSPDGAAVGDCVSRDGDDIKVVACMDATAVYKVAGKVENKTQVEFSVNSGKICGQFPNTKSGFWKGEVGKPGYILCLAPIK